MKREIKYQAWDTDKNEFVDCSNHTLSQLSNNYAGLGNRYLYREYTGLKDKNGKEIYEGDILHHPLNERWLNWLIEIIDGSTKLINIGIDGYRHDPMLLTQQSASGRIIIGNIHENPELLK